MENKIRVIQSGVGVIGSGAVKAMLQRPGVQVVGAVDTDDLKIGRDLGQLVGLDRTLGINVQRNLKDAIPAEGVDIVLHSTGPSLGEALKEIMPAVEAGLPVISSCEELCYPFHTDNADLAAQIDAGARKNNVVVLGIGVNPGFAMDKLVLVLAAACQQVQKVRVLRVVDASRRRLHLQTKVGVGLTLEQFSHELELGTVRHYGMTGSAWMIADQLGIPIDRVEEAIAPIVAEIPMKSQYFSVKAGQVKGIKQVALGFKDNDENIRLELEMYLGAAESLDSVKITGMPSLEMKIPGGIHGDIATAAILVNSIPAVFKLDPGLRTAVDLPMSFWPGGEAAMKATAK
jgi:hypothetical protein